MLVLTTSSKKEEKIDEEKQKPKKMKTTKNAVSSNSQSPMRRRIEEKKEEEEEKDVGRASSSMAGTPISPTPTPNSPTTAKNTSTNNLTTKTTTRATTSSLFLDAFYGLADLDPHIRSIAGQHILHHCFSSFREKYVNSSNSDSDAAVAAVALAEDAAYALQRLLNGLCSNRAAARQGCAATLTEYLSLIVSLSNQQVQSQDQASWLSSRINYCTTVMDVINSKEKGKKKEQQLTVTPAAAATVSSSSDSMTTATASSSSSFVLFVREQLFHATTPKTKSSSKSEERDCSLGRLLGLVAIIRSGILFLLEEEEKEENNGNANIPSSSSSPSSSSTSTIVTTTSAALIYITILKDLSELFRRSSRQKLPHYMREAVMHAIILLLNSFFVTAATSSANVTGTNTIRASVVEILIAMVNHLKETDLLLLPPTKDTGEVSSGNQNHHTHKDGEKEERSRDDDLLALMLNLHTQINQYGLVSALAPLQQLIRSSEILSTTHVIDFFLWRVQSSMNSAACQSSKLHPSSQRPRTQRSRRIHLVWEAFLLFVSEPIVEHRLESHRNENVQVRQLRSFILQQDNGCGDPRKFMNTMASMNKTSNPRETIQTVLNSMVTTSACCDQNVVHFLIRAFCGIEFTSSLLTYPASTVGTNDAIARTKETAVRARLKVESDYIEHYVLTRPVVQYLIRTAASSAHSSHDNTFHGNIAAETLDQLVASCSVWSNKDNHGDDTNLHPNHHDQQQRRLAVVRALLRGNPRVDTLTQTYTIKSLCFQDDSYSNSNNVDNVNNSSGVVVTVNESFFWDNLLDFMVGQLAVARDSVANPQLQAAAKDVTIDFAPTAAATTASAPPAAAAVPVSEYDGQGYVDVLFSFAKEILVIDRRIQNEKEKNTSTRFADSVNGQVQHILGALMAVAFFDCSQVRDSHQGKKVGGQEQVLDSSVLRASLILKEASSNGRISPQVRSVASCRFFSLVTLASSSLHSQSNTKSPSFMDLISYMIHIWRALENAGAILVSRKRVDDDDEEEEVQDGDPDENPATILSRLQKKTKKAMKTSVDSLLSEAQCKCLSGLLRLGMTLYLAMLDPKPPTLSVDGSNIEDEKLSHSSIVRDLLSELNDVFNVMLKPTKDSCPLCRCASFCVDALSSPLVMSSPTNGSYPSFLLSVTKFAWTSAVNIAKTSPSTYCTDPDSVVSILLDSIGVSQISDMKDGEDSENDSDTYGDGDGDNDSDEIIRGSLNPLNLSSQQNDDNNKIKSDDNNHDDNQDEVIDPERLQSLLEKDGSDFELEHFDGADEALEKFLQAKQESRKAGRASLECSLVANQRRCIMLLEVLIPRNRSDQDGQLLSCDKILLMIESIISLRKELEKYTTDTRRSEAILASAKRDLLERIDSLLNERLFRSKLSTIKWPVNFPATEFCATLCSRLMSDVRGHTSDEHKALCSSAILAILRATTDSESKVRLASIYREAASDWATKRTTRLKPFIFEELIDREAFLAQAVMPTVLVQVLPTARSPYLKSECCRLIARLFGIRCNAALAKLPKESSESDLKILAKNNMNKAIEPTFRALLLCFKDDAEMRKAKWSKQLIKTLSAVVDYSKMNSHLDNPLLPDVQETLRDVQQSSVSPIVKEACDRLIQKLRVHCTSDQADLPTTMKLEPNVHNEVADCQARKNSAKTKSKKRKMI